MSDTKLGPDSSTGEGFKTPKPSTANPNVPKGKLSDTNLGKDSTSVSKIPEPGLKATPSVKKAQGRPDQDGAV
jgi:hypothetical protein